MFAQHEEKKNTAIKTSCFTKKVKVKKYREELRFLSVIQRENGTSSFF